MNKSVLTFSWGKRRSLCSAKLILAIAVQSCSIWQFLTKTDNWSWCIAQLNPVCKSKMWLFNPFQAVTLLFQLLSYYIKDLKYEIKIKVWLNLIFSSSFYPNVTKTLFWNLFICAYSYLKLIDMFLFVMHLVAYPTIASHTFA